MLHSRLPSKTVLELTVLRLPAVPGRALQRAIVTPKDLAPALSQAWPGASSLPLARARERAGLILCRMLTLVNVRAEFPRKPLVKTKNVAGPEAEIHKNLVLDWKPTDRGLGRLKVRALPVTG